MDRFKKDDLLVITASTERENIGKVGRVTDITDGDYYTLDCLPNRAYKENCLDYAGGADLIREERRRQVEQEGYDKRHDFREPLNSIVAGAVSYAMWDIAPEEAEVWWRWDFKHWKPKDRMRNLVRAGALIAAAIDKLQYEERFANYVQQKEAEQAKG